MGFSHLVDFINPNIVTLVAQSRGAGIAGRNEANFAADLAVVGVNNDSQTAFGGRGFAFLFDEVDYICATGQSDLIHAASDVIHGISGAVHCTESLSRD